MKFETIKSDINEKCDQRSKIKHVDTLQNCINKILKIAISDTTKYICVH